MHSHGEVPKRILADESRQLPPQFIIVIEGNQNEQELRREDCGGEAEGEEKEGGCGEENIEVYATEP